MESINCATATGRRRLSLKEIAAKEKINGIYKENTTKGRVLAAFKRAAIPMGIGRGVVNLIDTLFAWSEPQDWQAGELCVVWPSNETLQRSLQLSVSRLKTLRRLAVEDGLIFMRESPNGHRGGYRENGQIVEAFGFDLSPLAARQAEFEAIAKADEERHREGKRLRRQIGSLRARVLSLIDLARLVAMDSDDWEATIEKAEAIYRLRGKSCDPIHLRPLKKGLDELAALIEERLLSVKNGETNPIEPENEPHYTTTSQLNISKEITTDEGPKRPSAFRSREAAKIEPQSQVYDDPLRGFIVLPALILAIAPQFTAWISGSNPSWREIIDTADCVRASLGISRHAWGQACMTFGQNNAAVVVAIIAAKIHRSETPGFAARYKSIHSPGGLLRKIITLYQQGELHLDRTLYGLVEDMPGHRRN